MRIKSVEDLFKHAGGAVQVAAFLELNQYTVDRWTKNGIPSKYYNALISRYDVELEDLHNISQKLRPQFVKKL